MTGRVDLPLVIREIVADMAGDLRVCMPGRIEAYDSDTHLAAVQPLLMRKFYSSTDAVQLPIINNVPVIHPRTATAMIHLPVSEGDLVTLVFADRSIERWLAGAGSAVDPQDIRQHHLSDAFAILGGYPRGDARPASNPSALEIVVSPGTKVTVGNGEDELIALAHGAFSDLKDLCDQLSASLLQLQLLTVTGVTTGGGVSGVPANAVAFATLQATVDGIAVAVQEKIDDLGNLKV